MSKEENKIHDAEVNAPNVENNEEIADDIEVEVEAAEENDLEAKLAETQAALEKEKKEYLFLMADFDNYRKRKTKEQADIIKNASEKTLKDLLPIVDDFDRGIAALSSVPENAPVLEGVELIYNKLIKYLADHGVKEMESTGQPFDADKFEAIATIPAPADDLKGKVIDTTTKGYTINDKVLRHAKVVVGE